MSRSDGLSRKKKFLFNAISFLFVIVVLEIVCFAYIKIGNPTIKNKLEMSYGYPEDLRIPDPDLNFKYRKNFKGYFKGFDSDGIEININAHGLRDEESDGFPSSTDVLFLGDSIPFGAGIAFEDTFYYKLKRFLENGSANALKVVNASVNSYQFDQYLKYLTLNPELTPDLIIVGFCLNDIIPTLPESWDLIDDTRENRMKKTRLQYLRQDVEAFAKGAIEKSNLGSVIAYSVALARNTGNKYSDRWISTAVARYKDADFLRVFENNLTRMKELVARRNGNLHFVVFPVAQYYQEQHKDNPEIFLPLTTIRAIFQKHDISYTDLFESFKKKDVDPETLYLKYDPVHFSPQGNEVISEILIEEGLFDSVLASKLQTWNLQTPRQRVHHRGE